MVHLIQIVLTLVSTSVRSRLSLQTENAALRQVVRVPEVGAEATYPTGRPASLVRHVEAVVGVARCSVLCPAQDRNDLAEKAIWRLLARAQSVE